MSDISILLDEQNQLIFDVEVQGVSSKNIAPRFIIEADGMDISFDGKFDGSKVVIDLPILANTLETDQYKCRLEMIVENEKFFTPMESTIDAVLPVKVRAGIQGNKKAPVKQSEVMITGAKYSQGGVIEAPKPLKEKSEVETKNFNLELKEISETGEFSGYGAMFGNVDSYNDIIQKGAFTKTLNERKNVKLLWNHQQMEPIGVFTKMYEDENGLVVEGKLALDVKRGQEAYSLMKMGAIDGLSIGYSTVRSTYDRKSEVRTLEELKLFEVSVVTFPANEEATVTTIKSEMSEEDSNLESLKNIMDSLQHSEPLENHSEAPGVAHPDEPEAKHSEVDGNLQTIINLLNNEEK